MKRFSFDHWLFGLLFLLLVISRILPYWWSSVPLGYDTGIYRYELWASVQALPEYISNLFLGLPLLTNVFSLFGFSTDAMLSFLYGFVCLLVPLSVALLAERRWGRNAAIAVMFLFLISLIQWKAYTMILFKQELALALVFFCFWLLSKRSLLLLFPLGFLALLQPLDALLVGLSTGIYAVIVGIFSKEERKYFALLSIPVGIFALAFWWFDPGFWAEAWRIFSNGISNPELLEVSLQDGVFLSLKDFGFQSAFFLVFGLWGLISDLRTRGISVIAVYLLLLILWIGGGLFFYQRLLIQLDAVLIFYSGFALVSLFHLFSKNTAEKFLFVILMIVMSFPMLMALSRFEPLIELEELSEIQEFCSGLKPGAYVAATDSSYAPWLRGYCLEQRVFGPGLFESRWSREDWEAFWRGDLEAIRVLLGKYEGGIYFYVGEKQPQLEFDSELFEWVEGGWWRSL